MSDFLTGKDITDDNNEKVIFLQNRIKELERRNTNILETNAQIDLLLADVIKAVTPLKPAYKHYKPSDRSETQLTFQTAWNDLHYGEVTNASEVEEINEFSPEIFDRRFDHYLDTTVDWLDNQRHGYKIDNGHIRVIGDLISGDIHDELRITNAFPCPVQAVEIADRLAYGILTLASHFEKLTVDFLIVDNHARLVKKPQNKQAALNSWNFVIAHLIKALIADNPSVVFNIHYGSQANVSVAENTDKQYLIMHGQQIRGWAGFPWYGANRRVNLEAMKYLKTKRRPFHKMLLGHFHTFVDYTTYTVLPSIGGTSAYDHHEGRYSEPLMTNWLFHPKYEEVNRMFVKFLEV